MGENGGIGEEVTVLNFKTYPTPLPKAIPPVADFIFDVFKLKTMPCKSGGTLMSHNIHFATQK